jgi:uncharacterized protein YuzE
MAISKMAEIDYAEVVHLLDGAPCDSAWLDYDREVDVLYVSFEQPGVSAGGEEVKPGIYAHYGEDGRLTGYTILHASKKLRQAA